MQHLVVVDMLQAEGQLHEPVQNLRLREALIAVFGLFDPTLKVAPLAVVHHDADVVFLHEAVMVANHIRMRQTLQHLNLR